MTPGKEEQGSGRKRWSTRSVVIASIAFILLATLLLSPRYQQQVATLDNTHRWPLADAPPRREFVWQPATPIPVGQRARGVSSSRIRPQLADNGNRLYFTIRSDDDHYDIVQSRRVGNQWTEPIPVDELNSSGNDIGPTIRADGQVLYLYSDRPGGSGGMDLYISLRRGERWTRPRNLGTRINSPAHEYDPAISPDGSQLFFASNRSKSMHRRMAAAGSDKPLDHWTSTLRTDLGKQTFDLYSATLDQESGQWNTAFPLDALNTDPFNEGSPSVSDDGAQLVFSSDRPQRAGESRNYDIYRSRLGSQHWVIEHLGPGVNSSAHEMEPSLVGAGFRIVFSRSRQDDPSRYGLYQSTAKEVFHDRQWDSSRWQSFSSAIAGGTRRLVDHFWWIVLITALLAALLWLVRQLTLRRIALPGFLLTAVVIHFLLVTSSFFVFFQEEISDRLQEMFQEETVVASQVLLRSTAPDLKQQPTFDQVADLEVPESAQTAEITKQAITPESAAIAEMQVVTPKSRTHLARELPSDAVVASHFVNPAVSQPQQKLRRRSPISVAVAGQEIVLEKTVAVEAPDLKPIEPLLPDVSPQTRELVEPVLEPAPPEVAVHHAPHAEEDDSFRPEMNPRINESAQIPLERFKAPDRDSQSSAELIETAEIAGVETPTLPTPQPASVVLPVPRDLAEPAIAQPEPIAMIRENRSAPEPTPDQASDQIALSVNMPASGSRKSEVSLKRSPQATRPANLIADVATLVPPAAKQDTNGDAALPKLSRIDIARQTTAPTLPDVELVAPVGAEGSDTVQAELPISNDPTELPATMMANRTASLPSGLGRRSRFRAADAYVDANANLRSLLQRRKLDASTKAEVIRRFGGNDQTLEAIKRGLTWIEQHQHSDGHWGLHDFHVNCEGHKRCSGNGGSRSDTAGTGLALLPFLGDGNTHLEGDHKDLVARGITWLVSHQKPDGDLFTGGQDIAWLYSHGIATIALCECYGMSGDATLRGPAQRAIDFIVAAQDPNTGGWRYRPRDNADTSVVGWQVMALKSGQMAELNIPQKSLKEAERWLQSMSGKGGRQGQFAYQRGRFNPAMTAEALLCLEYFGADRDSQHLSRGADYLLANLPKKDRETSYFLYYGTQTMFHLQGEHWKKWNEALHPLLMDTQQREGSLSGTWDPRDNWERSGGRIYSTSLRLLMLEVYYRHLPLYQAIE